MWELDYEESWELKNLCFWTMVLEKTLEKPLDCKEIQPVHPKGNQSWVFIGRTDVEAETPILWPPDEKNWLSGKDPDVGKDWGQEEKGTTEDEMVGWHHRLHGHELCKLRELVIDREAWHAAIHGVTKSWRWLNDCTELITTLMKWKSEKLKCQLLSHIRLFATPIELYPAGSSVHGILQASVTLWLAIPFSMGSFRPRVQTWLSRIAGRFFTTWATREALSSK